MTDTHKKMTRLLVFLATLGCACGGPEPEDVEIRLTVRNDSARPMQCRAGYVFNLIEQPEAMSEYVALGPASEMEVTFRVPHGAFATVAAECQAATYPQDPQYANAWRVTDSLTGPINCVATYTEPSGLSEFSVSCGE